MQPCSKPGSARTGNPLVPVVGAPQTPQEPQDAALSLFRCCTPASAAFHVPTGSRHLPLTLLSPLMGISKPLLAFEQIGEIFLSSPSPEPTSLARRRPGSTFSFPQALQEDAAASLSSPATPRTLGSWPHVQGPPGPHHGGGHRSQPPATTHVPPEVAQPLLVPSPSLPHPHTRLDLRETSIQCPFLPGREGNAGG